MSRIKARYTRHDTRSAERNHEIDLVLAVMCCLLQPGETVSNNTIAEMTGMSHGGAFVIEKRALFKLRRALRYTTARKFGDEIAA